jgi:hypothetical protein
MQVFNQNSEGKVESVIWEEGDKDKETCAWIGAEKCKTESEKLAGPSKGESEEIFRINVTSIFIHTEGHCNLGLTA